MDKLKQELMDLLLQAHNEATESFLDTYANQLSVEADVLIEHGVVIQRWFPVSEPPKKEGHYLVNIHQEDEEKGVCDFVLDAWYRPNGLLFFNPKEIGWHLLNEWYDLSEQLRPYITHWTTPIEYIAREE